MQTATVVVPRRENGKIDKRRRIAQAARAAFTEFGYKGANMREIARRADVATGTLFLYAPDKRSLLVWIVNEDLDRLTFETFSDAALAGRDRKDLLDQLIEVFEPRYRYWGADPELALNALQELATRRNARPDPTSHLAHAYDRQYVLHERIAEMLRTQQRRGRIRPNEDPETIAKLLLLIYNAAVRGWLRRDEVVLEHGIAELRKLLQLAIDGCAAPIVRGAGGTSN